MGAAAAKPPSLDPSQINKLRKEILTLFNGQTFLVLGEVGCGKSSLINTFGHVMRLADKDAVFYKTAEIAEEPAAAKLQVYEGTNIFCGVHVPQGRSAPRFVECPSEICLDEVSY